jgi:hypothetical protein
VLAIGAISLIILILVLGCSWLIEPIPTWRLSIAVVVIVLLAIINALLGILLLAVPLRIAKVSRRRPITVAALRLFVVVLIVLSIRVLSSSILLPLPLVIPAVILVLHSGTRLPLLAILISGHHLDRSRMQRASDRRQRMNECGSPALFELFSDRGSVRSVYG